MKNKMNIQQFVEELRETLEAIIPEELRECMKLSYREVRKNNDRLLHAVTMTMSGMTVAPTFYLEDCYPVYCDGASLEETAAELLGQAIMANCVAPDIEPLRLDRDSIMEDLRFDILDEELNRERLKDMVSRPLGAGFSLVPYILADENGDGNYRLYVTKALAEAEDYNTDEIIDRAISNTSEFSKPVFCDLESLMKYKGEVLDRRNPLSDDFEVDLTAGSFALSRMGGSYGACMLFLPGMAKRIGEALVSDYYVIPSSVHEVIIMPAREDLCSEELTDMLNEANRTIVRPEDILSNMVRFYDRKKGLMMCPAV